jgi:hypothetical protein
MYKVFLAFIFTLVQVVPAWSAQRVISADVIEGQTTIKNYLGAKGHFEKNANGWSGYDDAAATPVDGTGGTVTTTCTRTTTTPLSGDGSFLYTPAALGEGCSTSFTIDPADKGKVLQLSFDYAISSGTYTDDDTQIWIYYIDGGNSKLIQPSPFKLKNHSLSAEKFAVEFQTEGGASSALTYRLLIHQATAGTAVLKFDNMQLGPQAKLYGSVATDWVSYTPTLTNFTTAGANAVNSGLWRRVGDSMEIQITTRMGSTGTASGVFYWSLPSGYSVDTAKLNTATSGTRNNPGASIWYDRSASQFKTTHASYDYSQGAIWLQVDATNGQIDNSLSPTNSDDAFSISIRVPILGWSSSQIMSSDASTRVVAATMYRATDQAVSSTSEAKVSLDTVLTDTHGMVNTASNRIDIKVPGYYQVHGSIQASNYTLGESFIVRIKLNGATATAAFSEASGLPSVIANAAVAVRWYNVGDYLELFGQSIADTSYVFTGASTTTFLSVTQVQGPSQIAASETVAARYTNTVGTAIPNVDNTILDFPTKDYDYTGMVTTGASFKATAPVSGLYAVNVYLLVNSAANTNSFVGRIRKNGTAITNTVVTREVATSSYVRLNIGARVRLLAGDYIDFTLYEFVNADSLDTGAGNNAFEIIRVGNY